MFIAFLGWICLLLLSALSVLLAVGLTGVLFARDCAIRHLVRGVSGLSPPNATLPAAIAIGTVVALGFGGVWFTVAGLLLP